MYQAKSALFLYCISPVHMGAGTSVGVIDAPIQRERHTNHPSMAGSGIKGAIRHHLSHDADAKPWLDRYFGPENGSDFAGAVSFSDAQIVLFPARSLERSFMYVTCPTAVARLVRTLEIAGSPLENALAVTELEPKQGRFFGLRPEMARLVLDSFEFHAEPLQPAEKAALASLAKRLAEDGIPSSQDGFSFFCEKLQKDLVIISDHEFNYFVRHATSVEPHVKIDDTSGTAKDGGLFYVENLPPETLMVSLFMTTLERSGKQESTAETVLSTVRGKLNGQLLQLGGDATTGRGLVTLCFA